MKGAIHGIRNKNKQKKPWKSGGNGKATVRASKKWR